MPQCCAFSCNNKSGQGKGLFKFPSSKSDRVRREAWILAVSRKGWKPTEHTVLCSDHFTEEAFIHPPALYEAFDLKRNLRLRDDAVPTVFLHKEPMQPSKSSKDRKQRQVSFM